MIVKMTATQDSYMFIIFLQASLNLYSNLIKTVPKQNSKVEKFTSLDENLFWKLFDAT